MTTQEKIEVLEKAIPLIDYKKAIGICSSITIQDLRLFSVSTLINEDLRSFFPAEGFINPNHWNAPNEEWFCWEASEEGDEQRREFLRFHIERLKATL